jgi:hypothetical protein
MSIKSRLERLERGNEYEDESCHLCQRTRFRYARKTDPAPEPLYKCRKRPGGPVTTIIFTVPDETSDEDLARMNAEEESRRWTPESLRVQ